MHTSDRTEKFVLPIGPQHPALKEPGHFEFTLEGETVASASVRLGYVHRGIEKATESRNWTQNLYLLERICGICSHIHATAFALGVERLAGVEAPPRAQAIRSLLAELERIHSHFLWLGVTAHQAGFDASAGSWERISSTRPCGSKQITRAALRRSTNDIGRRPYKTASHV